MDPQQTDSYFPPMPTPSSTNPLNATSMNLQQTECGVPYAETLYLTRVDAIRAYALEHPRTTEGFQKGDLIPESLLSTFHKNFMRQAYEVAIKRNWSSLHAEVYADGALIKLLWGEEALGFHDLKGRNWTLVELLQLLGFPSADRQAQYMLESAFDSPDFILPMFRRLLTSNLHPDFWWQQTFGKMSISSHAVQEYKDLLTNMTMQQQVDWLANKIGVPAVDYEPASEPRPASSPTSGMEMAAEIWKENRSVR